MTSAENEIKLSNATQTLYSKWGTLKHRLPQGSILGPLLFIIYINDLPPMINTLSEPNIFPGDMRVKIPSKISDNFCLMSNTVLSNASKWYTANKLALNLNKTSVIKFITNILPQYALNTGYDEKQHINSINTKFFNSQIDNH
jgi:hypothetical protein